MADGTRPYKLTRRRESITADEVIKVISQEKGREKYTAEKIFAVGLIEAAINEIING